MQNRPRRKCRQASDPDDAKHMLPASAAMELSHTSGFPLNRYMLGRPVFGVMETHSQSTAKRRPLAILIVFGVLILGTLLAKLPGTTYPSCDTSNAIGELAKLYDNQRLLHAVAVEDPHLLSDGLKGRYCLATVKWQNGSQSNVPYEFYWAGGGRSGRAYLYMYIQYNGGMLGPTYR